MSGFLSLVVTYVYVHGWWMILIGLVAFLAARVMTLDGTRPGGSLARVLAAFSIVLFSVFTICFPVVAIRLFQSSLPVNGFIMGACAAISVVYLVRSWRLIDGSRRTGGDDRPDDDDAGDCGKG